MEEKSYDEMIKPLNQQDPSEDEKEVKRLNEEINKLEKEEEWLDSMLETAESELVSMAKDPLYEYAYVTYDDIKTLNTEGDGNTIIAIRAP